VDKDVIVDKTAMENVNNLPIVEELNVIVEPEFDVEKISDFTNIDTSIASDVEEGGENNAIFVGDGAEDEQR
jgi:hypothetical protein